MENKQTNVQITLELFGSYMAECEGQIEKENIKIFWMEYIEIYSKTPRCFLCQMRQIDGNVFVVFYEQIFVSLLSSLRRNETQNRATPTLINVLYC